MKIEIDGLIFDSKKLISIEKYEKGTGEYTYPIFPRNSVELITNAVEGIAYYLKLTLESSNGNYFNKTLEYENEFIRNEKYDKLYDLIQSDEEILKL